MTTRAAVRRHLVALISVCLLVAAPATAGAAQRTTFRPGPHVSRVLLARMPASVARSIPAGAEILGVAAAHRHGRVSKAGPYCATYGDPPTKAGNYVDAVADTVCSLAHVLEMHGCINLDAHNGGGPVGCNSTALAQWGATAKCQAGTSKYRYNDSGGVSAISDAGSPFSYLWDSSPSVPLC